ncbi:MAG: 2-dehydropantoate 2-reductase [Syntrophobacterales bacterium]|nr:MAG: 2-dehydropantoate 2-reductase [Syntrophobacterales bacterium]
MGGFFGGILARRAKDVTLIARGAHLEAMRTNGLTVKSELYGDFTVPVQATVDPREVGPVDLILFCVKTYDLEAAAKQSRPLLGENTLVIPVQNGIEVPDQLAQLLGGEHILGGLTYVAGSIEAPGIVAQRGVTGELIFGELQGGKSPRVERVLGALRKAGLDATLEADIRRKMWEKFIVICATGGVLAVLRQPFGPVFASPETSQLMQETMKEVYAIAQASGIELPNGIVCRLLEFMKRNLHPTAKSSMLQDLLAGRRLELEYLNGAAVRLGRKLKIDTPVNFFIYAALKPYVQGFRSR